MTFWSRATLDAMWDSGNDLGLVVEQIYSHFNEFKLLLCCSAGTKYAWFLHDIVVMEQQETLAYMEEAKKHGVPVKEVDPKELHLLMTAYTNALFEVVVHDFTKEEALPLPGYDAPVLHSRLAGHPGALNSPFFLHLS